MLSEYLKQREGTDASVRLMSAEAVEKLTTNPSLAKLNSHERIVTMGHESERYVPTIDGTQYYERNYLARQVVKPSELESNKNKGPIIDILS